MVGVKQVRSGAGCSPPSRASPTTSPSGSPPWPAPSTTTRARCSAPWSPWTRPGWIRRNANDATTWEVTTRMLRVSHEAYRRTGLPERTRATLERLRDDTGETVILNVPEDGQVVIVDLAESAQLVRTVPTVGLVVPALTSAAGLAMLAALPPDDVERFLGVAPDPACSIASAAVRRPGLGGQRPRRHPGGERGRGRPARPHPEAGRLHHHQRPRRAHGPRRPRPPRPRGRRRRPPPLRPLSRPALPEGWITPSTPSFSRDPPSEGRSVDGRSVSRWWPGGRRACSPGPPGTG